MEDWAENDVEILITLRKAGKSVAFIAGELRRSPGSVHSKISRMQLPLGAPVRVKVPTPPMAIPKVQPSAHPVRLVDVEPQHCRTVLDLRGDDGLAMFCGEPKQKGSSYCAEHHAEFYQPTPKG